jgi:hypothetical protein
VGHDTPCAPWDAVPKPDARFDPAVRIRPTVFSPIHPFAASLLQVGRDTPCAPWDSVPEPDARFNPAMRIRPTSFSPILPFACPP